MERRKLTEEQALKLLDDYRHQILDEHVQEILERRRKERDKKANPAFNTLEPDVPKLDKPT